VLLPVSKALIKRLTRIGDVPERGTELRHSFCPKSQPSERISRLLLAVPLDALHVQLGQLAQSLLERRPILFLFRGKLKTRLERSDTGIGERFDVVNARPVVLLETATTDVSSPSPPNLCCAYRIEDPAMARVAVIAAADLSTSPSANVQNCQGQACAPLNSAWVPSPWVTARVHRLRRRDSTPQLRLKNMTSSFTKTRRPLNVRHAPPIKLHWLL
jgi:hypothetical protein